MRADIDIRDLLVKDVAAQLTEIAKQKPDATLTVREGRYASLIDCITYDPATNRVIIETVWNY